jgi:hypothetical protein
MSAIGFFFQSQQSVFLFFAALGLIALGLVWFTVWLVRAARRKIGNTAY